jgi:adenylyl- and sulfurtransferase ThiI
MSPKPPKDPRMDRLLPDPDPTPITSNEYSPWVGAPQESRWYRVILLHQNELGLKAAPFKEKQERHLADDIKNVIKREQLHLQSMLILQDRMLFFFPNSDIPLAIKVFREILGIQSISPSFSVERDLEKMKTKFLAYGKDTIASWAVTDPNVKFTLKFKSISAIGRRFEDIEAEWGAALENEIKSLPFAQNSGPERGKGIRYWPKKPTYTFHIEMREKGAYIYARNIPTIWGGMPVDQHNVFFAEWTDQPRSLIAALFMARRASIILPVRFQLLKNPVESADPSVPIDQLAKHYAYGLPSITLSCSSLFQQVSSLIDAEEDPCAYCVYARLRLIQTLREYHGKEEPYRYAEYPVYPKGIVFPWDAHMTPYMSLNQHFRFLSVFPLIGLSEEQVKNLIDLALPAPNSVPGSTHPSIPENVEGIDNVVIDILKLSLNSKWQPLDSKKMPEDCSYHGMCPFSSVLKNYSGPVHIPDFIKLQQAFSSPMVEKEIEQIIQTQQILTIEGKILLQTDTSGLPPHLERQLREISPELLVNYLRQRIGDQALKELCKK